LGGLGGASHPADGVADFDSPIARGECSFDRLTRRKQSLVACPQGPVRLSTVNRSHCCRL